MSAQSAPAQLVFTYGTLKSDQPNGFRMQQIGAKLVGPGRTISAYPLVVASEYNVPAMLHFPGRGHRVLGEVYAVQDVSRVDAFEGHPEQYRREKLLVELVEPDQLKVVELGVVTNDAKVECDCYFLQRPRQHLLMLPTIPRYYEGVLGLPFMPRIIGPSAINRRLEIMAQIQYTVGDESFAK